MMVGGEGSSGTKGDGEMGILKKGPWTAAEDAILMDYVKKNGEGNWNAVQKNSGLLRCGKSCRLRWANHLRPNLKKGSFSPEEEHLILQLHSKLGNKWARIATHLPGRTDNEIKNYWNTRIKRRQRAGLPLYPSDIQKNQCRLSPVKLQTESKPQFGQNPTSFSPFEPLTVNYSSTTSAPAPLIGHSSLRSCDPQQFFSRQQQMKRTREDNLCFPAMAGGSTSTASAAVPTAVPMVRFGSSNSSHSFQPQNYSPFSINVELPSSQYLPVPADDRDDLWDRNNSGLLDALLENTQGSSEKLPDREISMEIFLLNSNQKDEVIDDVKCAGEKSGTYYGLTDAKMKTETPEDAIAKNEDLSAMFDFMPPTTTDASMVSSAATATTWLKNNGAGEISNGQSSGVTEDEISLEMQHLASYLSIAGEDQDHTWKNIGSDQWVNMPGIAELGQIP